MVTGLMLHLHLRMDDEAIIVLDPVNLNVIKDGLVNGTKTFRWR